MATKDHAPSDRVRAGTPEMDEAARRELRLAYGRAYYQRNKERIAEQRRRYREQNRETIAAYTRAYRAKNREQIATRAREYRTENREAIASYAHDWYLRNRERVAERNRLYRQTNREEIARQKRAYRLRRIAAGGQEKTAVASEWNTELHLHLHGCLTPEQIWRRGRERWRSCRERLAWFEESFHGAWGRRPEWERYWENDSWEALARDLVVTGPVTFSQFQASFNLIIALYKKDPTDSSILRQVMGNLGEAGVQRAELRTIFPPYFDQSAAETYLDTLTQAAPEATDETGVEARFVVSLPREGEAAYRQSLWIRRWQSRRPGAQAAQVVGVDFADDETKGPASALAPTCRRILADNEKAQHRLAVLAHVGETFPSWEAGVRWVADAHLAGVQRLGHALALGRVPAVELPALTVRQRMEHLQWIAGALPWLREFGYDLEGPDRELARLAGGNLRAALPLEREARQEEITALQEAVLARLAADGAVIECCPTSNIRLGPTARYEHHPISRFLGAGVRVVVASDDPGLFATNLQQEGRHLLTAGAITRRQEAALQREALQVWEEFPLRA